MYDVQPQPHTDTLLGVLTHSMKGYGDKAVFILCRWYELVVGFVAKCFAST